MAVSTAVRPPPITTTGRRSCRLAMEDIFAAPVSCSPIRKSDAWRTPRASPPGMSRMVGLPAPMQSAIWSKPIAQASSMDSVPPPPKRTPPKWANWARRTSSSRTSFR